MIDRATIDRILAATRIEEVVGEYTELHRRGANLVGRCPFHTERTPSFTVHPDRGFYKCFGCGAGGNAISFIMEAEKATFPEAVRLLARRVHIEVEERELSPEELALQSERESLMAVVQWATAYFARQLLDEEEGKRNGLSYLRERGIAQETIQRFQLGYSPQSGDALTQAALQAGYKLDYLAKTGLTAVGKGRRYDRFRERVIFPIQNVSGRTIGFGGRALRMGERTAKYVNSPESEIYHKGDTLYGLFQAKAAMARADRCVLVEGYLDVLSLHQAGLRNVVASSGTALTVEQVRLISRFTQQVTLLYDGDGAGITAAGRGADILLAEGCSVRIALLPDGQDPDDFARGRSLEAIERFLEEESQDFIGFKTNLLRQGPGHEDPAQRASLTHDLLRTIALVPDEITRTFYLQETARVMGVEEEVLAGQLNTLRMKRSLNPQRAQPLPAPMPVGLSPAPEIADLPPGRSRAEIRLQKYQLAINNSEFEVVKLLLTQGDEVIYPTGEGEDPAPGPSTVADYILETLRDDQIQLQGEVLERMRVEYESWRARRAELPPQASAPDPMEGTPPPADPRYDVVAYLVGYPDPEIARLTVEMSTEKYPLSQYRDPDYSDLEGDRNILRAHTEEVVLTYQARLVQQECLRLAVELESLEGEALQAGLARFVELVAIRREFAEALHRIII